MWETDVGGGWGEYATIFWWVANKKKNKMVAVRKFHVASNLIVISNQSPQSKIFTENYCIVGPYLAGTW